MAEKLIIGRTDFASFPKLGLTDLPIKIDSGAYTSSLHCDAIEQVERDEVPMVKVTFHTFTEGDTVETVYFNDFEEKVIKSSNGTTQQRFIVRTTIELFQQSWPIQLSLTDRSQMNYPVLIGRQFLNHKFIIDTALTNRSKKYKPA